jgi:hypothetical protein
MIKTIGKASLLVTLVMLLPLSIAATQGTVQGAASIFIMGPDGVTKNMELKAIKDSSGVKQVQDFQLGADNVVSVPLNGAVTIFGDVAVDFSGAKLTPAATTDSLDMPIVNGKITFAGVAQGVYTLDVIVGDKAYECLVVIGDNPQQLIINQITEINTDNTSFTKIFEKGKNNPSPSPTPEPSICYFKPNDAEECKPVNGTCPNNWPMNEAGNCHPGGKCPSGFERVDDDETGTCYSDKNTFHCPGSNAIVLDQEDCAIYEPEPTPKATPTPEPTPSAELKEETPTPTPEAQDEPLDSNCGGVPCTASEKEDSWLSDGPESSPGVPAEPEPEQPKEDSAETQADD